MPQTPDSVPADWLSEEGLVAATGISRHNLVRWRQQGLIPKPTRRFLGFAAGTASFYPPIAAPMIRRLDELRRQNRDVDAWFWGLWLDGYPIDIAGWADARLARSRKRFACVERLADLKAPVRAAAGKPATRTDPHRPLFRRLQGQEGRRTLLLWAGAVGVGIEPAISLYDPNSLALDAFKKVAGAEHAPDRELEVESMSLDRLRGILGKAAQAEMEHARRDCKTIDDLAKMADAIDWHRTRSALNLPRQGVPGGRGGPIAPFERFLALWRNFDARAAFLPFLIFLRRLPEYSRELDERLANYALELRCLACPLPEEQAIRDADSGISSSAMAAP